MRLPVRLDLSTGLNLVDPVDRCRPGSTIFAVNNRCVEEGIASARPGYTTYGNPAPAPKLLHSIRRLNDPDASLAPSGYTYIVGNGTTLDAGVETALTQIGTGYSSDPLSILTFRPEQSPESWAYVYDRLKQSKVRADGSVRAIGVAPPNTAPNTEYGIPAFVRVADAQDSSGWGFAGAVSAIGTADRTNGSTPTIGSILYNSGTTGWCCISPASIAPIVWAGERMRIDLNSGGETPVVREIHAPIPSTTIAAISYDSGMSGLCSIVLTSPPPNIARNSLITLNSSELIRVLSVVLSPDGSQFSIRCSTAGTFTAGQSVDGAISWYTYTTINHAAGEAIASMYISASQATAGIGSVAVKTTENSGVANGRPISVADDYTHISIFLQNPQNVVTLSLLIDVDPGTPAGTAFTNNYYQIDISQDQLGPFDSSSGDVWVDVTVPLSQAKRNGNNLSLGLNTVQAVGISLTTTGACSWGFDWWYNFGTYGPVIQPNSPVGYFYASTFRESTTGAASVPGPITRYSLNPLREAVLVTPATTAAAGIDYDDIYREGGTLTDFVYIGSVANNNITPNVFLDGLSDFAISGNPGVDLTLLQPWPVLGLPLTGVVNVVGTSVKWVSGSTFPTAMLNNTVILLNGVAFLTRGQPHSTIFLELQADAGVLTNAVFSIASPTLAGQPMPLAFGPLEGPFVPVAFALGDPVNSGTLYYSNSSNLDAAADTNTLELTGPTEPLVTGEVWNGFAFAGSRENVFVVQYSFTGTYQFRRIPGPSGFWSRWTICRGPDGIYALGRDGIYKWTDSGAVSITDDLLYPLFPHDGQAAVGANGLLPVDMNLTSLMRLSATDFDIRFTYYDTGSNQVTLRYEIARKRWFLHSYGDQIAFEYLDEPLENSPNTQQIILLSRTLGNLYLVGGDTDNNVVITTQVQLPYLDNGDFRSQKLFVDYLVDADQTGTLNVQAFYNNGVSSTTPSVIALSGSRIQTPVNVSSVPGGLTLYRNVSPRFVWTGGPDGPRVYGFEPSFYNQPYLSKRLDTQFFGLSFPGWKLARRGFPALISNAQTVLTIQCQNGRQFTINIPSTGGQFLIQPIMAPQTVKDLAFAFSIEASDGSEFAVFPEEFTWEWKEWSEPSFVKLAIFKA